MIAPRKSKEMANRQLIKKTTSADNISILNITISQRKIFRKAAQMTKKSQLKNQLKDHQTQVPKAQINSLQT